MISATFKGQKQLLDKLQHKFPDAGRQTMVDGLGKLALAVQSEAVRSVQEIKGSQVATRYNPKRTVTVSPPGAPFNTDTGAGVASIYWDIDVQSLVAQVGSKLSYLAYLEYGTATMEARPWLMPAVNAVKPRIPEFFQFKKGAFK